MWLKYGWVSGSIEIPSMIEQKTIQTVDRQARKINGLCLRPESRPCLALRQQSPSTGLSSREAPGVCQTGARASSAWGHPTLKQGGWSELGKMEPRFNTRSMRDQGISSETRGGRWRGMSKTWVPGTSGSKRRDLLRLYFCICWVSVHNICLKIDFVIAHDWWGRFEMGRLKRQEISHRKWIAWHERNRVEVWVSVVAGNRK